MNVKGILYTAAVVLAVVVADRYLGVSDKILSAVKK